MHRRPVLLLIGLTAILFADVLAFGRGFYKGDLFTYHYPMKHVVRELGFGQWNPYYHAGQPLAANPAYEVFYPPQWLIFAGSFPFAFQLHILVHIAIAAIGMYLLLRDLDVGEAAAIFGACAFAFGAPYLSLVIRLPFLFAMTWLPLVLMFARRVILRGRARDIALGALAFAMQALIGEPTTVLQTGALALAYLIFARAPRRLPHLALMFAGGLLIAAVQLIPALDHARDSVRAEGFDYRVASNWSTPPKRLAEVAFPQLFRTLKDSSGNEAIRTMYDYRIEPYISDVYAGLLIVILAAAGIVRGVRGRWLVLTILIVSTLFAIGGYGPLFRTLFDWHLLPSVRYPEKFLLAGLFALIVYGSVVLDQLARDAALRRLAVVLVAAWSIVAFFIFLGGASVPWIGMNVARATAAIALVSFAGRGGYRWVAALVAFAVLDGAFMHFGNAARASRDWFRAPRAAALLKNDGRLFHKAAWDAWESSDLAVAHFGAARELDTVLHDAMFPFLPAAFGFSMALEDDIDQTALLTSTELSRAALDVKRRTGAWHPWFLRAAGVRHVAEFVSTGADPPIAFRDLGPAPRFWFAARLRGGSDRTTVAQEIVTAGADPTDTFVATPLITPSAGLVMKVDEQPARIALDVEASGAALLVASITRHKYWRATVDGKPVEIIPANLAFQGIAVPEGKHRVELRYANPWIARGAIVSILALVACVVAAAVSRGDELAGV